MWGDFIRELERMRVEILLNSFRRALTGGIRRDKRQRPEEEQAGHLLRVLKLSSYDEIIIITLHRWDMEHNIHIFFLPYNLSVFPHFCFGAWFVLIKWKWDELFNKPSFHFSVGLFRVVTWNVILYSHRMLFLLLWQNSLIGFLPLLPINGHLCKIWFCGDF